MPLSTTEPNSGPDGKPEDDFENCKGKCGYTIWCRACMEERKKQPLTNQPMEDSDGNGQ